MKKIFLGIVCCLGIGFSEGYASEASSNDEDDGLGTMTEGVSVRDQLNDLTLDLSETEEIVKNDNQED